MPHRPIGERREGVGELDRAGDPTALVDHLIQVGIALTSRSELGDLLSHIAAEACNFAKCDGGTVYIREGDTLRLVVWRNSTLRDRGGKGGEVVHEGKQIPISKAWVAGYVAATGEAVDLPDAYTLPPGAPFTLDRSFDRENDYGTQSMLCVPMSDARGETVGVLQLVNCLSEDGGVGPFPREIEPLVRSLASQAAVAIQNAQLHQRLKAAYLDTIFRLSVAAEYRDRDTSRHIRRMSRYSEIIALSLGLDEQEAELIRFAAPMHDIGKIGIPDSILLKPGPLTPAERRVIQEHTTIGRRILGESDAEIINASSMIALHHHERWDGTGYPGRLARKGIPLHGRIVALADALDCICSERVYKAALSFGEAVALVRKDSGTHFCPECVDALLRAVDRVREVYLRSAMGGAENDETWIGSGGVLRMRAPDETTESPRATPPAGRADE
jgi:putative two-component system response regulator